MSLLMLGSGVLLSQAADAQEQGGDVIVSIASDAVSMDPHGSNDVPSNQMRRTLYEGLVKLNVDLEIEPLLATDWEVEDDTVWTFTLREGVQFHDGTDFNAEAVKANFDRILDPAVASERAFLYEAVEEVNVVDDYTVEIVTRYPYSPLLEHLSHDGGGMISAELIEADYQNAIEQAGLEITLEEYYEVREAGGEEIEELGDELFEFLSNQIERGPVGTGYLEFVSRSPGSETVFQRNENYWGDPAYVDTVTFKVVTETGSRLAELETGSSHMIFHVESANIDRVDSNDDLSMMRTYGVGIDYIGFNVEKEPFDDVRVRQAISHALDKEAVMEGVYNDSGAIAHGPIAPDILGYDENVQGLDYDMERAAELLEEAGYADGFSFNLMTNDNPERVTLSLILQESLAELNVDVNVQQMEWGAYLEMTGQGEHDMFVLGWSNSAGSSDNALVPLFHSDSLGDVGNRSFYVSEELDALLDAGKEEVDDDAREQIYKDATEIIIHDAPAIFVRHGEYLNAHRNELTNVEQDRFNNINFKDLYFE